AGRPSPAAARAAPPRGVDSGAPLSSGRGKVWRRLHRAHLGEVRGVVADLEHPPLGNVQLAEGKVLERQSAGVQGGDLLKGLSAPGAEAREVVEQPRQREAALGPDLGRRL